MEQNYVTVTLCIVSRLKLRKKPARSKTSGVTMELVDCTGGCMSTESLLKFVHVVFEKCDQTDRRVDIQLGQKYNIHTTTTTTTAV